MLVLGLGFKRIIVDPLIKHGVIPLVIATLGLSIGLIFCAVALTATWIARTRHLELPPDAHAPEPVEML